MSTLKAEPCQCNGWTACPKCKGTWIVLTAVLGFFDKYRPFSNFHLQPITLDGHTFPSNEHYFQWKKGSEDNDPIVMHRFYENVVIEPLGTKIELPVYTPTQAKQIGRTIKMREDWPQIRDSVMYLANYEKYKAPELKTLLLETGDAYLEETNWWHDNYWGNCAGTKEDVLNGTPKGCHRCTLPGINTLGQTLMKIRSQL